MVKVHHGVLWRHLMNSVSPRGYRRPNTPSHHSPHSLPLRFDGTRPTSTHRHVGEALELIRASRCMPKREFEKRTGIPLTRMWLIENGIVDPEVEELKEIEFRFGYKLVEGGIGDYKGVLTEGDEAQAVEDTKKQSTEVVIRRPAPKTSFGRITV
eukprot:GHVN01036469.1.p1 GENE.GHVN01036469.1~~GHVN01036469.1.p1  ORF type:complete len:155 (-),score=25.48 GHVN01036469.1:140-604(-)